MTSVLPDIPSAEGDKNNRAPIGALEEQQPANMTDRGGETGQELLNVESTSALKPPAVSKTGEEDHSEDLSA